MDFVGLLILLALAVLFGWLTSRAWRAGNRILKWLGTIVAGLLTVLFSAVLIASLVGYYQLNRAQNNPVAEIAVAGTEEQIARGERLATICLGCHSSTGELPYDGQDFLGQEMPIAGTLYAPNLTPAHLGDWTDGEIIRAIREGVNKDGRGLIIMPASMFHNFSDEDVQSIVAFLRTQEPVEPDTPPIRLSVVGSLFMLIAPLSQRQEPITEPVVAPPEGPTAEYGQYITSWACSECHGHDLAGTTVEPVGPNLTVIIPGRWSEEEFLHFWEGGERPDGTKVDPEQMPVEEFSAFFNEEELRAVYAYINGLKPIVSD